MTDRGTHTTRPASPCECAAKEVTLSFANGKHEHLTDLTIPLNQAGEGDGWTLLNLWGIYPVRVKVKLT